MIPGVASIGGFPALDPPEIDASALDSEGAEFILGLGDPGSLTFTLNLRRNTADDGYIDEQETLEGYAGDNILRGVRIRMRRGSTVIRTYLMKGVVRTFVPSVGGPNSLITAEVNIRISGGITKS